MLDRPEAVGCTLMDIREHDGNPGIIEIPNKNLGGHNEDDVQVDAI
jgi:hypothetical protein